MIRGQCRVCGCIEEHACMTYDGPCAWADDTRTLCTACVDWIDDLAAAFGFDEDDARLIADVQGTPPELYQGGHHAILLRNP